MKKSSARPARNADRVARRRIKRNTSAKNLHAENGHFENLTVTGHTILGDEVCVNDDAGEPVCLTGSQLRSLLNALVLGASSPAPEEEAAGATQSLGGVGDAGGSSTSEISDADDISSTTPASVDGGQENEDAHEQEDSASTQPDEDAGPIIHGTAPAASLPTPSQVNELQPGEVPLAETGNSPVDPPAATE